jgi:Spy/CpxP family protein refolding chaperone
MKARHLTWMMTVALGVTADRVAADPRQDSATTTTTVTAKQHGERAPSERREGQRRIAKWWIDASERLELGISDQQSAKIEAIFQSTLPAQRDRWREHEKLEPAVEQLIKDGTADPADVARQVERLHTLKAELNATRITTLYRMLRELSPEQREKFRRMDERRGAERRKSTDSHIRR